MKLTSSATSKSIHQLIEAQVPNALDEIEQKVIKGGLLGNYGVEIQFIGSVIGIETVLDVAVVGECRLVNQENPTFAFNTTNLKHIKVVGVGDFIISIV